MYELINYFDVWGNEQDGWEINNQCVEKRDITIVDDAKNDDIIEYLKNCDFLTKDCTADDFYILWDCDYIEIYSKKDGMPLYCFRKQEG